MTDPIQIPQEDLSKEELFVQLGQLREQLESLKGSLGQIESIEQLCNTLLPKTIKQEDFLFFTEGLARVIDNQGESFLAQDQAHLFAMVNYSSTQFSKLPLASKGFLLAAIGFSLVMKANGRAN